MTDYKQLCGELLNRLNGLYEEVINAGVGCVPDEAQDLMNRAWDALSEPEPEGPTEQEWDALAESAWDKYRTVGYQGERFIYERDFDTALGFVREELARWGNHPGSPDSSPQPVPVSERLPYDSDRNAKGECWWLNPGDDETGPFWCLYEGPRNPLLEGITHWLPADALPLPQPH